MDSGEIPLPPRSLWNHLGIDERLQLVYERWGIDADGWASGERVLGPGGKQGGQNPGGEGQDRNHRHDAQISGMLELAGERTLLWRFLSLLDRIGVGSFEGEVHHS